MLRRYVGWAILTLLALGTVAAIRTHPFRAQAKEAVAAGCAADTDTVEQEDVAGNEDSDQEVTGQTDADTVEQEDVAGSQDSGQDEAGQEEADCAEAGPAG